MRAIVSLALGGVFLAGSMSAQDAAPGDRADGRKVAGMCRTCHGLDGFAKIPIAPHIGGEPSQYLAAQLRAFRDGQREHEMMTIIAKSLSDQQISDVSAWYAGHDVTASLNKSPDDAPADCSGCHGEDGIALIEDAPHLASETNIYLETQLKAFRSGKRTHEVMSPIAAELSDADIRAFADWYAGVSIAIDQRAAE